jgi:hypothetical protein
VWGGIEHEHEWGEWRALHDVREETKHGKTRSTERFYGEPSRKFDGNHQKHTAGSFCPCGAVKCSLGLEPDPEMYVQHLVEVFREVRRVLRDDGTLWLNLGDSYAGSGRGTPGGTSIAPQQIYRQGFNGDNDPRGKRRNKTDAPAGYKSKDLMMMPARVAMALQADGWYLRSQIPWLKRNCLSGGARVYVRCQKGDMPMTVKDLARLDSKTCKLWNGERWTQITGMWEAARDEGDPIEIELRSGERIGCTPEHRWPTSRGLLPTFALRVGDVLTGTWLPKPGARQPASLGDEDVGWFVGLYVAEGSRSRGTIQIASHVKETERFERLCRIAAAFDGTCRAHLKGANGMTINLHGPVLNAILDQYVGGRLADDKHLTNRCWMRSNEFLRAVLNGYLHGDGHWDEKNQRWRLGFTRNYGWEGDLRTIAARLNIDLRLKLATIPYDGHDVGIFRGSLRFERTTKLWTKNEREIMRIGHSRGRKFWDIAVEDDPHTFALASGVLTHNSMPESVIDRPATSVEYVYLLSKQSRYFWDADAVRTAHTDKTGGPERFGHLGTNGGYVESDRTRAGGVRNNAIARTGTVREYNPAGRNRRNSDWFFESWQGLLLDEQDEPIALIVNPAPFKNAHFATFSPRLVEPMVKASTSEKGQCPACGAPWVRVTEREGKQDQKSWSGAGRENGCLAGGGHFGRTGQFTVNIQQIGWRPSCAHTDLAPVPQTILDPFAGAGTTLLVADRLGRDAIGCELNSHYGDMGIERLRNDAPMFVEFEHS